MGRKRFLTIIGSLMIGVVSLIIVYLSLILTNVIILTQADIEITSASAYKEYDGTPLTNNNWTISKGYLAQDHVVEIQFLGSQLDAGTSKNDAIIKVKTIKGKDVTKNYNITFIPGSLTVDKKPISIQSQNAVKEYDGTPLKKEAYEVKSGFVLPNHQIKATFENTITNAGSVDNVFDFRIYDENLRDVTENYSINKTYGVLTVEKRKIEIQSGTATKVYDATPLENDEYEIISGSLVGNHQIEYESLSTITDAMKVENTFSIRIVDAAGVEQTNNYDIRYINGTLEITKRPIKISTASKTKYYDGLPLSLPEYTVADTTPVVEGHTYTIVMSNSTITYAGEIKNDIDSFIVLDADGNDVSHNYHINDSYGTLEVLKRPFTLKTADASKYYDGTPLTNYSYEVSPYTPLPLGHYEEIHIEGKRTEVGSSYNYVSSYKVFNELGEDVTYCFEINIYFGELVVKSTSTTDYEIITKPGIGSGGGGGTGGGGGIGGGSGGGIGGGSGGSGGSGGGGGISQNPFKPDNETVMYVTSTTTGPVYLRDTSFGDYNKKGFNGNQPVYDGPYVTNPIYLAALVLKEAGFKESDILIEMVNYKEGYKYPSYGTNAPEYNSNDYKLNIDFNMKYELKYINYRFASNLKVTTSKYSAFELNYRKFVYDNYLALPNDVLSELNNIITENKLNRNSSTIIEDVLKYVGSCAKYNLEFNPFPEDADVGLYFLKEAENGICQHFATAATILYRALGIPARYTVGYYCDAVANEKVAVTKEQAHAWVEIYINGMGWVVVDPTAYSEIEEGGGNGGGGGGDNQDPILPPNPDQPFGKITIKPVTQRKLYDGTPLESNQETTVVGGKLQVGHKIVAVISGSQTEVGKGKSIIESFKIIDEEGNDITDRYEVEKEPGLLHVYKSLLQIKVHSNSKIYDGTKLTANSHEIVSGLLEGHELYDVVYTGYIVNAGQAACGITYKVRDIATQADVSDLYYGDVDYGILEVLPISIVITIGSAEKVYDGTPLTCHEFTYVPLDPLHPLLDNHDIYVTFNDSLTEIGYADNTAYSIEIVEIGVGYVTRNYKITVINGTLHVKPY